LEPNGASKGVSQSPTAPVLTSIRERREPGHSGPTPRLRGRAPNRRMAADRRRQVPTPTDLSARCDGRRRFDLLTAHGLRIASLAREGAMRTIIALALTVSLQPAWSFAQTRPESSDPHRVVKVIVGGSAIVVGALSRAKSSQTAMTSSALGASETSSFSSKSIDHGARDRRHGDILVWDGRRDHVGPRATVTLGVGLFRRDGAQLFFRPTWSEQRSDSWADRRPYERARQPMM
jgi:hypothetical protein